MKPRVLLLAFACLAAFGPTASGTEITIIPTWQPLDGQGNGGIVVSRVPCCNGHAESSTAPAIGLISAPNIPPTNDPKRANRDVNLASLCGLVFTTPDLHAEKPELRLDASAFRLPERGIKDREAIVRATLECLRLTLPKELLGTALTVKVADADKPWLEPIAAEFNKHDRSKVFYTPAD